MNAKEFATEYRMTTWAQALQERAANKESIKTFCERRKVSRNTYFYWQRKLREKVCEQLVDRQGTTKQQSLAAPGFTEVQLREPSAPPGRAGAVKPSRISVEIKGAKISADSTYPPEQLAALCRELVRPC